ncbi:MAG: helix-turn-helix transcriptional regulator [Rhodospirillales bacterium]
MDDAWARYNAELEKFGVQHACYGFMASLPRVSVTSEVLTWSSHDPAFTAAYMDAGHPDHDWSVIWSMTEVEAKRWHTPDILDGLTPRQRQTEGLAWDFGLYEGVVIPLRGGTPMSWGGIGLAAPDLKAAEWHKLLDDHQMELEMISQAFHETVLRNGYFDYFELSPREKEVLTWIVCGLDKHQIAEKLNISSKTAEVHIYRVRRKLNCANDAQVVAKALVFNLVEP